MDILGLAAYEGYVQTPFNIPFNQLYYIAENCADRYSKVIKTFVFLIKRQFVDRQTLLVNTTHSLKFLEEYTDRQAQIWKVL